MKLQTVVVAEEEVNKEVENQAQKLKVSEVEEQATTVARTGPIQLIRDLVARTVSNLIARTSSQVLTTFQ